MSKAVDFMIELRTKSVEDLIKLGEDRRAELFALKFQAAVGSLEQTHRIPSLRKDIARIEMLLGERRSTGEEVNKTIKADYSKAVVEAEKAGKEVRKKHKDMIEKLQQEQFGTGEQVSEDAIMTAMQNATEEPKEPIEIEVKEEKPAPVPKKEVVVEPKPAPAPKKEVVVEPKPAPAPKKEVVVEPKPAPAPKKEVVVEPKPAPAPKKEVVVEPKPAPAPKKEVVVETKPAPAPKKEVVVETKPAPAPKKEVVVEPKPAPAPKKEVVAKPKPAPAPKKEVVAKPKPAPAPKKEVVAKPKPAPAPKKEVVAKPKPAPAPKKEVVAKPKPAPAPKKEVVAKPKPASTKVSSKVVPAGEAKATGKGKASLKDVNIKSAKVGVIKGDRIEGIDLKLSKKPANAKTYTFGSNVVEARRQIEEANKKLAERKAAKQQAARSLIKGAK